MAVFNPDVPVIQAKDFDKDAKPISDIGGNKAFGAAFQAAGGALEGVVNLADTIVKKDIESQVYKGVDTERDAYTAALEATKATSAAGTIPSEQPTDIIGPVQPAPAPPVSLQSSLESVENLAAARADGKINDTYYTARLNSVAKNIRNQYPGYRDYIDQKIAQVSGMNPANAYYRNLMEDINKNATNANTAKNKIEAQIRANMELPNAPAIMQMWKNGQISDNQVDQWVNKYQGAMYAIKADQAVREAQKGSREEIATTARSHFIREAGTYVNNSMETIQLGTGTQTIAGALKWLDDIAQNPNKADPKQIQEVVTALSSKRQEIAAYLKRRSNQLDSANESYSSRMGGSKAVDEEISSQLSMLDSYITNVGNDKQGVGTIVQRQNQAVMDRATNRILSHPAVGDQAAMIAGLNKIAPNYSDLFSKALIAKKVDQQLVGLLNETTIKAVTQPPQFLEQGKPFTLAQANEEARKKGVKPKSQYYDRLFEIPQVIADPNPAVTIDMKENAATAAFHPSNAGILDTFKQDYYDDGLKAWVPGKLSIYTKMTSPQITAGMWDLRNKSMSGKEYWDWYKEWGEREFATVARSEIQELNQAVQGGERIKFTWDTENNRLAVVDPQGRQLQGMAPVPSIASAQRSVNRINSYLSTLSEIQKREGGDTGAYMLRTLATVNPQFGDHIQKQISSAIIAANTKRTQSEADRFYK